MKKEIDVLKIRKEAEEAFKSGELNCSETIVASIRNNIEPKMPKELISAASGFSMGVGGTRCMCSGVSAAVICLGYFFGRNFPTTITDPESLKTIKLSFELQDNIKQKQKVHCCFVHLKGKDSDSNEHKDACANRVGDAAVMVAEIIARELKLNIIEGAA